MEVEIGLKITQTRDDLTSTSDLRIAKDASGLVFLSKETENMFFLTAHLKGYRREHIDIQINEDGTRIVVSGMKPVQEKVMIGWVLYKKEVELRGFRKVFTIPQGVVLDKIKAKFNKKGSILTISMPKLVKGISSSGIEEVEEQSESKPRHETSTEDYKDSDSKMKDTEKFPSTSENDVLKEEVKEYHSGSEKISPTQTNADRLTQEPQHPEPKEDKKPAVGEQRPSKQPAPQSDEEEVKTKEEMQESESDADLSELIKDAIKEDPSNNIVPRKSRRKKCKICCPAVAGSAVLVSIIVVVFQLIKAKQK